MTPPSPAYAYEEAVLTALARHGLKPLPDTPPPRLRDAVLDLYKYELIRLRHRLLAGEFERHEYAPRVIELRKQYWLLSVPTGRWTIPEKP